MAEAVRRVLIVDPSRVIRTTLAKHLREHFDVREESDGESAWQSIVLDPFVIAVICGPQPEKISGFDLLARIRASKIRRIKDLDFLLIISGSEGGGERQGAREKGVTEFIARGMSRQEVLAIVSRLGRWDPTQDASAASTPPPAAREPAGSFAVLSAHLEAAHGAPAQALGVLQFGLDGHASLHQQFGADTMLAITERIARVLGAKIGAQDTIQPSGNAQWCIVSPGNTPATCIAFARRVCRGLANSEVRIRGNPFKLVVSAGIACAPMDGRLSREALVALAARRLEQAQKHGGNRIVATDPPEAG